MRNIFKNTFAFLFLFVLFSCDKIPVWQPDIYAPIATSRIKIDHISTFRDLSFEASVAATSLNDSFTGTRDKVKSFKIKSIGPFEFPISDMFSVAKADSMDLKVFVINNLPIQVDKGTKIVFKNNGNKKNTLFTHVLKNDVLPGETILLDKVMQGEKISNSITLDLDNFSSEGSKDPVTFLPESALTIKIQISFIKVDYVMVNNPQTFELVDTAMFDLGNFKAGEVESGKLEIYFNNNFPFKFTSQIYFLDTFNVVIDSFFSDRFVLESALVNEYGRPEEPVSSFNVVDLTVEKLETLERVEKVKVFFKTSTVNLDRNGNPLTQTEFALSDSSYLDFRLVGDLSLNIQNLD